MLHDHCKIYCLPIGFWLFQIKLSFKYESYSGSKLVALFLNCIGSLKLIFIPGVLKMLGKLGRELPLRQWLSNVPRITTIIIKDAPNRWGCRGPAVVLAVCPASWVAARL